MNKESRGEIKSLYVKVISGFEKATRRVFGVENPGTDIDFAELSAQVELIAPAHLYEKYVLVAELFSDWQDLHRKASPTRREIGDQTYTIFQSPDPTAEYKKPAEDAHEKFRSELSLLIQLMKTDLEKSTLAMGHGS